MTRTRSEESSLRRAVNSSLTGATGLHDVRIPVTDAWKSRDWYMMTFGFVPVMDVEDEDRVVGVVLRDHVGLVVGLHEDPPRARALRGFALLGLGVGDPEDLMLWVERLDLLKVAHGSVQHGHLGCFLEIPDPDGIIVRIYSGSPPNTEEA
jgi:catechol 2,3-dioxygenase-like lactoylglutathione lyase family enzyme